MRHNVSLLPAVETPGTHSACHLAEPSETSTEFGSGNSYATAALQCISEIEGLVETLVASWHRSPQVLQNRRLHRTSYLKPICITPLDDATQQPAGRSLTAMGRDLSLGGVSFSHHEPLPYRVVVITFTLEQGRRQSVVTRLQWCRFTRQGEYQSGGKFLRCIEL